MNFYINLLIIIISIFSSKTQNLDLLDQQALSDIYAQWSDQLYGWSSNTYLACEGCPLCSWSGIICNSNGTSITHL